MDKGHGRLETRTYAVKDITAPEWDDYAQLHGRRQAIRIVRERPVIKTGKTSIEETWALTSPGPDETAPEQLAAMIRNHWHIENRLHYVRDFTYDGDRCRASVRDMPRNPACRISSRNLFANAASHRTSGHFKRVPRLNLSRWVDESRSRVTHNATSFCKMYRTSCRNILPATAFNKLSRSTDSQNKRLNSAGL